MFCRECALANLLAQKKEHKRTERDWAKQREMEEVERKRGEEDVHESVVRRFEEVQAGLERKVGSAGKVVGRGGGKVVVEKEEEGKDGGKGVKRKFEIDEEELLRIGREERGRMRVVMDEEVSWRQTISHKLRERDADRYCRKQQQNPTFRPFGFPHKHQTAQQRRVQQSYPSSKQYVLHPLQTRSTPSL